MPRRRDRVAPPPASGGWDLRFANNAAVTGWEEVCATAPSNARAAWECITTDPRRRNNRQHPLRRQFAQRVVNGTEMEQWQYEVTAGGRIWYCIDDPKRTVWMTEAFTGHPKATE